MVAQNWILIKVTNVIISLWHLQYVINVLIIANNVNNIIIKFNVLIAFKIILKIKIIAINAMMKIV